MHDVVLSARKDLLELPRESNTDGHSCLRSIRVNRLASSETNDVRRFSPALDIRGDDVYMMAKLPRFAGEEMHMLYDSTQMRVVVLGDDSNAEWSCKRWSRAQ